MKVLLIHQNYPGQYAHFLKWLVDQGGHQIVFLTQREQVPDTDTHTIIRYKPNHDADDDAYAPSKYFESCCGSGIGAVEQFWKLRDQGFKPDIAIGHAGWGEMMFLKDVWPDVPMLSNFEYHYRDKGGAVNFDPEFPSTKWTPMILRARNACHYITYEACDAAQTATQWQKNIFPESFHDKLEVIHDGVMTDVAKPNPGAQISLGRLERPLTADDEVFTYIARNMEPIRGFHTMMRALPRILDARPNARAIMIGGSDVSYGGKPTDADTYRGKMEKEVGDAIDWSRVHFVGRVPYDTLLQAVQLSRCHIYLTVPFVLSWSFLESMAMEKTIVASKTAPVEEIMTHGETGLLVDFFSPGQLANQVIEVLENPSDFTELGKAAREHILTNYDFKSVCLPQYIDYVNTLLPRRNRLKMRKKKK